MVGFLRNVNIHWHLFPFDGFFLFVSHCSHSNYYLLVYLYSLLHEKVFRVAISFTSVNVVCVCMCLCAFSIDFLFQYEIQVIKWWNDFYTRFATYDIWIYDGELDTDKCFIVHLIDFCGQFLSIKINSKICTHFSCVCIYLSIQIRFLFSLFMFWFLMFFSSLQPQVRTLFVSGLPMDAKPRELYLLFRAYEVIHN